MITTCRLREDFSSLAYSSLYQKKSVLSLTHTFTGLRCLVLCQFFMPIFLQIHYQKIRVHQIYICPGEYRMARIKLGSLVWESQDKTARTKTTLAKMKEYNQ